MNLPNCLFSSTPQILKAVLTYTLGISRRSVVHSHDLLFPLVSQLLETLLSNLLTFLVWFVHEGVFVLPWRAKELES